MKEVIDVLRQQVKLFLPVSKFVQLSHVVGAGGSADSTPVPGSTHATDVGQTHPATVCCVPVSNAGYRLKDYVRFGYGRRGKIRYHVQKSGKEQR